MKGRRATAKLVPFAEVVLFKVPKTHHRVGKFEDRWGIGVWVGFVMRTGEHLVATENGVYKVSTLVRRPADKRWSATMTKAIAGTPGEPIPGSGCRKLIAFASQRPEASAAAPAVMPAHETAAKPEPRRAKVIAADIDTHGASQKCPGCRAYKNGKYKASHTTECRKRFETLLADNVKGRRRF